MIYLFYIIGVFTIAAILYDKMYKSTIKLSNKKLNKNYKYYIQKKLMTNYEKYFYNIFTELEKEYNIKVQPQVNLATIIDVNSNTKYHNELFRNIDFAIFTKDYEYLLLLIEINDKTHSQKNRIKRDQTVKKIVEEAGIKLITFYSNYPNNKEYVLNRIKKELNIK